MRLTTVRNTNQETIIHFDSSYAESGYINIADLAAPTQVRNTNVQPQVNIVRFLSTGEDGSTVKVLRDGYTIISCAPENAPLLDLISNGISEAQSNVENIEIQNVVDGKSVTGYITLRKIAGWDTTVETATYGAYDDPAIVGPQDISGSPGPANMPREILPQIGSGAYNFTLEADMSEAGTAYTDNSYYYDAPPSSNMIPGLYRTAYAGNFTQSPGSTIDTNFCRTQPGWYGEADPYVGFGFQDLENASNYTFEWTGWFRAPKTGTYNFWLQSDDVAYMWMNSAATVNSNNDGNQIVMSNNNTTKNNNSLILTEGMWYPVRIQFGEWGGAEQCQVYWATTDDSVAYAGNDGGASGYQVWYYNGDTQGI